MALYLDWRTSHRDNTCRSVNFSNQTHIGVSREVVEDT